MQVSLLFAFGSIAAELDSPDDAFLGLCLRVTERIVGAYIYMWPKQRPAVHDALAQMIQALEAKPQPLQALLHHFVEVTLTCTLAPPNPDVTTGARLARQISGLCDDPKVSLENSE